MCLRISSAALLLVLTACGAESPPPPGDIVDCAIGAGADLSPVCTLEMVAGAREIVIHHPDGGFRRLSRDLATGTLAPLDGAEALVPEQVESEALQFVIGADRYSIPPDLLEPAQP
ncbi:MAG: hypothetical protein U0995_04825 [Erythrobacter sp.]|nr:hypothetical protein [Erythrobacter sp.]MDZ4275339.1 hypothetical protein [Erythrobacter sp.]